MGLGGFSIAFNNLARRYKPLDIVSGKVLIQVTGEAEKVDGLTLELSGWARTEWDDNHQTLFKGEELVYLAEIPDVASLIDRHAGKLPVGSHFVTFNTLLPVDIPFSFENKLGTIRYRAEAVMKRSGFLRRDERRSESFFITQELDLNLRLENFLEASVRDTTAVETCSLTCCLREQGELEVSFRIPKRGYVCGETVELGGHVYNNSTVRLRELSVSLEQCIVYLAGDTFQERRSKKDILHSKAFPLGLPAGQTKYLSNLSFRLPHDLQWISNAHCSIIQISYRLRLVIDNSFGWYKLPLVVGSVPLHSDPAPPNGTASRRWRLGTYPVAQALGSEQVPRPLTQLRMKRLVPSLSRPGLSRLLSSEASQEVPYSALIHPDEERVIIRRPVQQAKKEYQALVREDKRRERFKARYGVDKKTSKLVIACKDKKLNHYEGQKYPSRGELPLVSSRWRKERYAGDWFTIRTTGGNPSYTQRELGDAVQELEDFELSPELLAVLKAPPLSVHRPTLIQQRCWPTLLAGVSGLVVAETGSGKTLAYGVPLVQMLLRGRAAEAEEAGPSDPRPRARVLIATAGRELVAQTAAMMGALTRGLGLSVWTQGRRWEAGEGWLLSRSEGQAEAGEAAGPVADAADADILVGSPEMLRRLLEEGLVSAGEVVGVALDEADTLLDDSFSELSLAFLDQIPFGSTATDAPGDWGPQLIAASATFPSSAEELLSDRVDLSLVETLTSPAMHRLPAHVVHRFHRLLPETKNEALLEALKDPKTLERPRLVFANNFQTVELVRELVAECGVRAASLHGNLHPRQRSHNYAAFLDGHVHCLVATDLASRGLDTRHVAEVINYDFPMWMSDYLHRAGRVGRVGSDHFAQVSSYITKRGEVPLLRLIETAARRNSLHMGQVDANIARQRAGTDPTAPHLPM